VLQRLIYAGAAVLGLAFTAEAQIGRPPAQTYGNEPSYWVGLSYGYMDGYSMSDDDSQSHWAFGGASQIRATFEKTVQRGITIGAAAGFSTTPLIYSTVVNPANGGGPCGAGCRATADVTQLMAFVHGGGGYGFHPVYDLEGGFTEFANFRERSTDVRLAPTSADFSFTFGFGGGLGYGFSQTTDVYVSESYELIIHPSESETGSAPRALVFRAGFRVGF
jgi:hypothetical protein